jgi:hypothetical protein
MTNRRTFLQKTAMGSVVIAGLSGLDGVSRAAACVLNETNANVSSGVSNQETIGWSVAFDEATSTLSLQNGQVALTGKLSFVSDGASWTVARSRDGVPDRYALVNAKGNVQGYLVFIRNGEQLQLLFYHRTAQAYHGVLSFTGEIRFPEDGFACRTQARTGERVLSLICGEADSLLNDSLFSPSGDLAVRLHAANLQIETLSGGTYSFNMSGRIEEAAEAEWTIMAEKNYFKNRYVPYYHPIDRKRCAKAPTGWMSWNTYFDKATAEDNLNEAKIGRKYLQPFGCEFWSIESWQGNSDQLPVSDFYNMDLETNPKQFPKGMKKLAADIRALGFRPGIWMAPFGTGNTKFYQSHREWFLHDKSGNPIRSWNGRYTLDPTVAEAREHLKKIFDIAAHEWGYEFFKVDGMSGRDHGYCAHLYERPEIKACFKDPSCPNPFELCVRAFREGIGNDRVLLACQGHTSGAEALYADASRIGADIVHPNQPVKWANVLNQGRCLINQVFTHNISMVADPDTLLIHDLTTEEAGTSATIVALPGQLTFFGDKLAGLSGQQMKILQQTLPVADVRPAGLYPYFTMLPVWNLQVRHQQLGDYNVVALFNWQDAPQTVSVTPKELGINARTRYTGYEFWTEKAVSLAPHQESWQLAMEVPAHGVRVVALHPVGDIPRWVGSDRHITQSGMELVDYAWDKATHTLKGKIRLIGTFPLTMRIRVPEGYLYGETACNGATHTVKKEQENLIAVTLLAQKTADVPFSIVFRTS